jgi:hypothetical protein
MSSPARAGARLGRVRVDAELEGLMPSQTRRGRPVPSLSIVSFNQRRFMLLTASQDAVAADAEGPSSPAYGVPKQHNVQKRVCR